MTCQNSGLLNEQYIFDVLLHSAKYKESHGATDEHLGSGLLYYTLVYMLRAEVCLCLGSGGGFVPRLMRQAQRDLSLQNSRTILIDANYSRSGWGCPDYFEGNTHFTDVFPDIEIIKETTVNAFQQINCKVDYLHIDADHDYWAVRADWNQYKNLVGTGIITIHDTNSKIKSCGVKQLLEEIGPTWEMLNFPMIGEGIAILRKKQFKIAL